MNDNVLVISSAGNTTTGRAGAFAVHTLLLIKLVLMGGSRISIEISRCNAILVNLHLQIAMCKHRIARQIMSASTMSS